ncbi:MAG: hypothetical protein KGL95_12415 [Patescibacteria group bacterium]|nr:hypothetical protein [Patescibacteria group bacterium]
MEIRLSTVLKSLSIVAILALALFIFLSHNTSSNIVKAHADGENIVGAWTVNAVGAPFQPHVMEFHGDQTLEIDNPEAGDTHTSDSVGMGPWSIGQDGNNNDITGKFVEINADRTTNQYVSKLVVTFTVTVSGNSFTGPASATYYNPDGSLQAGPFPATLNGTKVTL